MMARKRWADLSSRQKKIIIVLGILQFSLLAAALWDIAHRDPEEVRGKRGMWAGLAFIDWFGPIAYFAFGRKRSECC